VGACTTAFNTGLRDFERNENMPKLAAFKGEKIAHFEDENTVDICAENISLDMPKKAARKRTKGTGDTDTTGKHNKRFKAYCKAVKEGKINPSRYALTRHEIDGKKIGSATAVEFLLAMETAGFIQKIDKGGKTTYTLA